MLSKKIEKSLLDRNVLDDLASIKISEVESLLESRQEEIKEEIELSEKDLNKKLKVAYKAVDEAANKLHGDRVEEAVDALNSSDIFPKLDYTISCYDRKSAKTLSEAEDVTVSVEISLYRDENKKKIITGSGDVVSDDEPITIVGKSNRYKHQVKRSGQTVMATTAVVPMTDYLRSLFQNAHDIEENIKSLQEENKKITSSLNRIGSIDRKVRANIAAQHLGSTDEGQQALGYLKGIDMSTLSPALKALENKDKK